MAFGSVVLGALAGAALVSACHGAEVVDSAPLAEKLASFRSARILVAAPGLDDDDAREFGEELEKKLGEAEIFRQVVRPNQPSELLIRVSLLDKKEDGSVALRFAVELFDERNRRLIGRFDVTADSKSDSFSGGGSINVNFDSKTTRALEKAEDAILSHLEDLAKGGGA